MARRRKTFTATQSKITSRRLRTATLGTHMPTRVRTSRHMNGDAVGFSSARKQKRAARGFVEHIPLSSAGAPPAYAGRVSRREFSQGVQRRARTRRIAAVLVCLIAVAGLACGVGAATYFGSLDGKLALEDSDVSEALSPAKEGEAYYTVVAVDLDRAEEQGGQDGPDAVALVRTDPASCTVSVLSVPANTQVSLKDGKTHALREAAVLEGDASLASAVAGLADVSVSHYVKADAEGVARLVDALGGVEVDVAEEVDDPSAGDVYIPAGTQTLDGNAALTFLRASNFQDAQETQAANQRAFLAAVALRFVDAESLDFLGMIDKVDGAFRTDVSAREARSLAEAVRGMEASAVRGALIPGYETTVDDAPFYAVSGAALAEMMERVEAGEQPQAEESFKAVDPGSFTVTVRNGGGVSGAAAQLSETLSAQGFDVVDTGNTDTAAYTETLVIHRGDDTADAARTLVEALGAGRVVADADFYTFDTDVLVILGTDWRPAS